MSSDVEQRWPAAGIRDARIESTNGDVTIDWAERDEIVVRGPEVEVDLRGDTVVIKQMGRGVLFGLLTGAGVEVELPDAMYEGRIQVHHGDLVMTNPRGDITARVDHGDVRMEGGRGELSLRLGAGDVTAKMYEGSMAIHTGAGSIKLTDVQGEIDLQSGTGEVTVRGGDGDVSVKTGAGDTAVLERTASKLSIKTGAGDATIRDGAVTGTSVQTGMGDISCEARLGTDDHGFTTGSGDISIAVPRDLSARIEVTTARGSIDSEVPLVTVGKRGPKSLLGRRLVGSVGESDKRAEISVRSLRGDVRITWLDGAAAGAPSAQPRVRWTPTPPTPPTRPTAPTPPTPPTRPMPPTPPIPPSEEAQADASTAPTAQVRTEPGMHEETTRPIPMAPPTEAAATGAEPGAGEERAILAALAAGSISVAEAERLLDALTRRANGEASGS